MEYAKLGVTAIYGIQSGILLIETLDEHQKIVKVELKAEGMATLSPEQIKTIVSEFYSK